MELTLNLPSGTVTSNNVAAPTPAPQTASPVASAPFVPQAATPAASLQSPTVAMQMEAGTAGAGSVAGLGATQFPPLNLDFDANQPKSQSAPIPAMTSTQLATIARNKLELAGEYIELGDLPGARTLLQEVIASNDPATRQQATTLLSTLASHS
jgi:pilus assembly protein FimV